MTPPNIDAAPDTIVFGGDKTEANNRDKWRAMRNGFRGKCPNCGDGKLFVSYAKSVDSCSVCDEEISHHRADDFPAYLVIFIVGHLLVPLFIATYVWSDLNMWAQMAIYVPLTIIASLWLLPRVKGAVIGLQWALKMHGFSGYEDDAVDL